MGNLNQLDQDLQALKEQCEHYEQQIMILGVQLSQLPEDVSSLLDECAALQLVSNLHTLEETHLKVIYSEAKKTNINLEFFLKRGQNEIKHLGQTIEKNEEECNLLSVFLTDTTENSVEFDANLERNRLINDNKLEGLHRRQRGLKETTEGVNMDELIKKLEILVAKKPKFK